MACNSPLFSPRTADRYQLRTLNEPLEHVALCEEPTGVDRATIRFRGSERKPQTALPSWPHHLDGDYGYQLAG
jgi:hypothetical protein